MRFLTTISTVLFSAFALSMAHGLPETSSLWEELSSYGFETTEKKVALLSLLKLSGVTDAEELLKSSTNDPNVMFERLINLVEQTQKHFVIRTGTQERWEYDPAEWMQKVEDQEEIIRLLATLGVTGAVNSSFDEREAVVVLGARKSTMDLRAEYVSSVLPCQHVVLLAGERYVTLDNKNASIDGTLAELKELAESKNKDISKLTETDLIQEAYKKSTAYTKHNKHEFVVIDTPRGDLPRPTTETTTKELLEWLKQNPDIKKVTFISNQPHVAYQEAVIREVMFQQNFDIEFEVIGPEYNIRNFVNKGQAVKELVGALGAYIFAQTPAIVRKFGFENISSDSYERFKELYKSNALVYKGFKPTL